MLHKVEKHKQPSSICYSNRSSMCFAFLEKLTVSIEVDEDKDGYGDDDNDNNDDSEFDKLLKSDQ
ncbi:hypothetical protein SLEP1_g21316 [Rubroshorea leprosula]|uniref:Uncharacterized protein n=1 Tax=Rubroshorea leprosula TaxID=152421 RepID=A0AAV5JET4_9ROSI|nr:hypothetical protein SLEP1_g21316 [Rubroshorea leprosula]